MKHILIKSVTLTSLVVISAAATALCYDVQTQNCGSGLTYPCGVFCTDEVLDCEISGLTTRVSVRQQEDCVSGGVSWEICDDKETPKTDCTKIYKCLALSNQECLGNPGKYQCVGGGEQVGHSVYWVMGITAIYCGA